MIIIQICFTTEPRSGLMTDSGLSFLQINSHFHGMIVLIFWKALFAFSYDPKGKTPTTFRDFTFPFRRKAFDEGIKST